MKDTHFLERDPLAERRVRVLSPTGVLGAGFKETSLQRGVEKLPHVIACDGGSTDSGPHYLGSGQPKLSREATRRDLRLIMLARDVLDVPLLIGSCGTAGTDAGVRWIRDLCLEIAEEEDLSFRLACIYSQQQTEDLVDYWRAGVITPLPAAPPLSEQVLRRCEHVVGMMGHEPLGAALEQGADIILAGRATDTSLFAAVPLRNGMHPGASWHAAKIIECGAACAENAWADSILAHVGEQDFIIESLDPDNPVTPRGVAAHTLYENADPLLLQEPGGTLDTSLAEYLQLDSNCVLVSGSQFNESTTYTVKLEGASLSGFQTVVIGGIRDPYIIRQLDSWLGAMQQQFAERVELLYAGRLSPNDYDIDIKVYGRDAVMGAFEPGGNGLPHEVGILFTVTAPSQEQARNIAKFVSHAGAHFPIPEWKGIISSIAYPFSPAEVDRGAHYQFALNHVVTVQDPLELFRFEFSLAGEKI